MPFRGLQASFHCILYLITLKWTKTINAEDSYLILCLIPVYIKDIYNYSQMFIVWSLIIWTFQYWYNYIIYTFLTILTDFFMWSWFLHEYWSVIGIILWALFHRVMHVLQLWWFQAKYFVWHKFFKHNDHWMHWRNVGLFK